MSQSFDSSILAGVLEQSDADDPGSGPRSQSGGVWGRCPECLLEPVTISVRSTHWATCPTDKTRWCLGENLFTTYVRWTDEEMVERYGHADRDRISDERVALLRGYREVEGVYPPREVCPTCGM